MAALRIFRDEEADERDGGDEPAFRLNADAGSIGHVPRSGERGYAGGPAEAGTPTKRPWAELCAAIQWDLGPEVWMTAEALEALLRRCGVENFVWMMQGFPPERIVLATCYGLWMALEKKLKAKTPGPLVNKLLRDAETIDDRRHIVLPIVEREFRSAAKRPQRKTEGA